MALVRANVLYPGRLTTSRPNVKLFDYSAAAASSNASAQGASNGSQFQTFRPETTATTADPYDFQNSGWIVKDADKLPADSRGRAVLPAGTIDISMELTATNSATTAGTANCNPIFAMWALNTGGGAPRRITDDSANSQSVGVAALGGTSVVTASATLAEDFVLERGEAIYVQLGGRFTSPSGLLGASNVTTFTLDLGSDTSVSGVRLEILYDESGAAQTATDVSIQKLVSKKHNAAASATGVGTRSLNAFRVYSSNAIASATTPLKYVRLRALGSIASGAAQTPSKTISLAALLASAAATAPRPLKLIQKSQAVNARATGLLQRTLNAYRSLSVNLSGQTVFKRAFIGVRKFITQSRSQAKGRIEVPMERLPFGDGQIINVIKKVIQVFDD